MANTAANSAMEFPIGVATGTGSPSSKRMHHPLAAGISVGGRTWLYVFNNSGSTITAGTVGAVRATVNGVSTNTLVSGGTGFVLDKSVPDQYWYWVSDAEGGGIGLLESVVPTVTFAAGATNKVRITVTFKDGGGTTVTGIRTFRLFISDSAAGAGLTATAASGEIVAVTGTNLDTVTSHKEYLVQTAASGIYVGDLTDTSKTQGYYFVAVVPETGLPAISSTATVTASYG